MSCRYGTLYFKYLWANRCVCSCAFFFFMTRRHLLEERSRVHRRKRRNWMNVQRGQKRERRACRWIYQFEDADLHIPYILLLIEGITQEPVSYHEIVIEGPLVILNRQVIKPCEFGCFTAKRKETRCSTIYTVKSLK